MSKSKNLVYSTDPVLNQRIHLDQKKSTTNSPAEPQDGIVRIHRESKGRGGKGVCVIHGLAMREDELKELAKKLKQHCGTGGTVKNDTIEIQGEQREKIKLFLEKLGHKVKLAGG